MPDPLMPPEPFGPNHAGHVMILTMFRGYRDAGGGWIESALLVVTQMVVNMAVNPDGQFERGGEK